MSNEKEKAKISNDKTLKILNDFKITENKIEEKNQKILNKWNNI